MRVSSGAVALQVTGMTLRDCGGPILNAWDKQIKVHESKVQTGSLSGVESSMPL